MTVHTVDKDSEAQEGKVPLPFDGVPADVGVALHQKHGAALEATACQIGDHLQVRTASQSLFRLQSDYPDSKCLQSEFKSKREGCPDLVQIRFLQRQRQAVVVHDRRSGHVQWGGPPHGRRGCNTEQSINLLLVHLEPAVALQSCANSRGQCVC